MAARSDCLSVEFMVDLERRLELESWRGRHCGRGLSKGIFPHFVILIRILYCSNREEDTIMKSRLLLLLLGLSVALAENERPIIGRLSTERAQFIILRTLHVAMIFFVHLFRCCESETQ